MRLELQRYRNGRPALTLVRHGDARLNGQEGYDGEPWATASVNAPDIDLPVNSVVIKSWSEGEGLAKLLVASGVLKDTPPVLVPMGHAHGEIYELSDRVARAVAAMAPMPVTKPPRP